jgi:acetylornithine/succinyldiaminopimelate/putrescine aminotransferase
MFDPLLGRLARALAEIDARATSRFRFSPIAEPKRSKARSNSRARRPAARRSSRPSMPITARRSARSLRAAARRIKRRSARCSRTVVHVPYGDAAALERRPRRMRRRSSSSPCKARAASSFQPLGYLRAARELCDRAGALLIAMRCRPASAAAAMRFACDRDGVVPDVMTLAKGLSGGVMPIGAYIARPACWNARVRQAPLIHTSTFGGNPLACCRSARRARRAARRKPRDRERACPRRTAAAAARGRLRPSIRASCARCAASGLLCGVELRNEGYAARSFPKC